MKPIKFIEDKHINKPEYITVICVGNKAEIISCWKLSWKERLVLLFSGIIWLRLLQWPGQTVAASQLQLETPFKQ